MTFDGFQKMTLLDFPGKIACTLFTHGCNFRCHFCHDPETLKKVYDIGRAQALSRLDEVKEFITEARK